MNPARAHEFSARLRFVIPRDLLLGQTWAFVASRLRGAKRILEVGCGDGALARHLANGGLEVTALDIELTDRSAHRGVRFVEKDFLAFDETGFDALLFTSSLHHIAPLDAALDRAVAALRPGGVFLAEEFAVEAPDESTARWFYGMKALLAGQGMIANHAEHAHDGDHAEHTDTEAPPLERWKAEHRHEPPLHTAEQMQAAIAARFSDAAHTTGPYLYRHIAGQLPPTPGAGKLAMKLFDRESEAIRDGRVLPIGRRFRGTKAG
jgi:SAM-dependent methyltransferase